MITAPAVVYPIIHIKPNASEKTSAMRLDLINLSEEDCSLATEGSNIWATEPVNVDGKRITAANPASADAAHDTPPQH